MVGGREGCRGQYDSATGSRGRQYMGGCREQYGSATGSRGRQYMDGCREQYDSATGSRGRQYMQWSLFIMQVAKEGDSLIWVWWHDQRGRLVAVWCTRELSTARSAGVVLGIFPVYTKWIGEKRTGTGTWT